MKIVTNGRQMVVGTELKLLFEKKLKRLDKYFDDDVTAYITLARKKNLERLELTISSKGTMFRSEVTADTFQTALDEAIEKITRQIVRNKTKLKKIVYSGEPDVSEPAEDEEEYNIKIVKTFDMHPMTSDEAILRMIEMTVENGHKHQCWVGICGELGADLSLTETFIHMGIDELSVTPSMVLKVRDTIRKI